MRRLLLALCRMWIVGERLSIRWATMVRMLTMEGVCKAIRGRDEDAKGHYTSQTFGHISKQDVYAGKSQFL